MRTESTPSVEELLDIEGAVAAGEFASDGSLVEYATTTDMTEELAETTAQFTATVTMLFDTLAGAYSELSDMDWTPQQGWAYSGGEYTIAVGGRRAVFAETEAVDFNRLFDALVGPSEIPAGGA